MLEMTNSSNAYSNITSLPLDILISLMDYLHPLDLVTLRKTCRALYDASHQRIVWIKALTEMSIANNVFLPTFQLDEMTTQELSQAAVAPSRWLTVVRQRYRQQAPAKQARGEMILEPSAVNSTPIDLGLPADDEVQSLFLVPGGRFVVLLTLHSLQVWDLGLPGKGGVAHRVTSIKMAQLYNLGFSAQPTKNGLGLRLVVPSYPKDTAANRRKQISVYEVFLQEDQPTLSEIAHLGVDSTSPGILPRLAGDLVVFLDGHVVKVWDFVNDLWAEWNTQKNFSNDIFVTSNSVLLLNHEETVMWRIPDLKPADQEPSATVAENVFSFPSLLGSGMTKTAHWGLLCDWYWNKREPFLDIFSRTSPASKSHTMSRFKLASPSEASSSLSSSASSASNTPTSLIASSSSATMSTTTTETAQPPPPLTFLTRVASIPLISSSLGAVDQTLSSSPYTRSLYPMAKGLSSTAYKYTEPFQIRLAPLITRADSYANKAVDVVEARYPYPFKAKPEEVQEYVRERRQSAAETINHSIDEKVKSPALHVATEIDHRFAPIVDYFEVAVNRITNPDEPGPSSVDSAYQYQRALALTRTLYGYSNEQLKQLQAHSALLQRATETAHSISSQATSSYTAAQGRVHQMSDNMLAELHKLQVSTASLSASFQNTAASTVQSHIPPHMQEAFADFSRNLSDTATEFSSTITTKDLPLQEKATKLASEVRERIVPLLGSFTKALAEILNPKTSAPGVTANGNAPTGDTNQDTRSDPDPGEKQAANDGMPTFPPFNSPQPSAPSS
ncbi:hypothetical protein D9756_006812 [Leucocoprinus leucothites]|uniref:F-box domain-containing protein n=1 Tax=Leucocoprinus leucothites TaxID=201217 RepID=A0A8H5LH10_9AGAR|nr:hypothetical protein D9756_006812 [Leucoagaricus leucothites]